MVQCHLENRPHQPETTQQYVDEYGTWEMLDWKGMLVASLCDLLHLHGHPKPTLFVSLLYKLVVRAVYMVYSSIGWLLKQPLGWCERLSCTDGA